MRAICGITLALLIGCIVTSCDNKRRDTDPRRIEILFLGHDSEHHPSARLLPLLASALSLEGINFSYTDNPSDLNPENLARYDGLMIYANHETIQPEQETALLNFVASGKGFLPIHCASFCFQNSDEYIRLVGGQFHTHDTATFVVPIIAGDHPVMQGIEEFSTWDETYVHHKLTDDRTVLMERVDGDHHEPWTWVKEHGKGRVFYTAYGHDERTWSNPGFHRLVKQGIAWAVGDKVRGQWESFAKTIPTLIYRERDSIPNYERRDPPPQYQEPLSPEESAKLIQVPPGFDLELFASEPDIINPVAMEWDERGRLWVIETVDYPNTVRDEEGVGDDRIKICEDTDGDGKADKFTVFADNLNIPTSLVFANGGVIVSQAPVFLFLKDTDGDDRADVREVIIDGWGTFDTHAGPSNLKYGLDNQIWGVVGYAGFNGTIAGQPRKFSQGIYRFTRDLSSFEFMTRTSNNTWGLGFTEANDVFASTANNTHSVFMGIPDRFGEGVEGIPLGSPKIDGHYALHPITDKVRQVDVFGGFTAAAGHSFYTARAYPKQYWNRTAFIAEPTAHLVHIARIEKNGAGFVEKDGWNLFASTDEWVAPVEAKVGPDGAVWILDWYNFIVQHNPTPSPDRGGYQAENGPGNAYVNPLRDRTRGRIWRVIYRDAEPYRPRALDPDNGSALVKALSDDNQFWRLTAQRLLVEKQNADVLPALYELIRDRKTGAEEGIAATHALWVLDGLNAIQSGNEAFRVVADALKHPTPAVRKAAIQILSQIQWVEQDVLASGVIDDPDPNTRMNAILSLTRIPPSRSLGEKLYAISKEENVRLDDWLAKAVYIAAATHRQGFIHTFNQEHPSFEAASILAKEHEAVYKDSHWPAMNLPTTIEAAGLNIDGIIWFRKSVNLPPSAAGKTGTLSLGPINDSDETWINGVRVGRTENQYTLPRIYPIPPGTLKAGINVIAVRVEDLANLGGIYGKPEQLFINIDGTKTSLTGPWRYEVEKTNTSGPQGPLFRRTSIADAFAATYKHKTQEIVETETSPEATPPPAGAVVIHIKALVNEMKYDIKNFTVPPGKPVRIIFENPDHMQHNLVITSPGAMETVGRAADKLATASDGAERQYVPATPEVLFYTRLVNPQETVTLDFVAPSKPGDYPFVCTFPGHWSIMNGVMRVTADAPTARAN